MKRLSLITLILLLVTCPIYAQSTTVSGQVAWDVTFLYVCVATNTWVRAPLVTWI
jgi:hypothetical protein